MPGFQKHHSTEIANWTQLQDCGFLRRLSYMGFILAVLDFIPALHCYPHHCLRNIFDHKATLKPFVFLVVFAGVLFQQVLVQLMLQEN